MNRFEPLPEFEAAFYRERYLDLASFTNEQLFEHWNAYGQSEGRVASLAAMREHFLEYIEAQETILEIGPFCNPYVRGPNVKYFDVLDSDALLRRAREIGYSTSHSVEIDYVSPSGDLGVVADRFAAVVSSHCIEHQPDLVWHLQQVNRILNENGVYCLVIPDKRYCFDHFIAASTVASIIDANNAGRKTHRLASVIEHRALTTHNDVERHWRGDHGDLRQQEDAVQRTRQAVAEFAASRGGYLDVHAWQFTPSSFRETISILNQLGLVDLKPEAIYATPHGRNEFTAVLRKSPGASSPP